MLSTRTKQVNVYGKRGKRVVDVTVTDAKPASSEIVSIFDDLPPAPAWAPIASRMKGRAENGTPAKPKPKSKASSSLAPAPKVVVGVAAHRNRRLSPILSPAKKPVRVSQLVMEATGRLGKEGEGIGSGKAKLKGMPLGQKDSLVEPARTPLSSTFPANVQPGSPVMPSGAPPMKKRAVPAAAARVPSKLRLKPTSPVVNVDIMVLDDEGRVISKERRSSRSGVAPKPVKELSKTKSMKPAAKPKSKVPIYVDSGNESEVISQPKQDKLKLKKRGAKTVISDDSDSDYTDDDDDTPIAAPKLVKSKVAAATKPPPSKPLKRAETVVESKPQPVKAQALKRASTIAIVVPPAPYPTKNVPQLSALPAVQRPSTPPKPRAPVQSRTAAFQLPPSPIFKGRQLTPIRGGRARGLFGPESPESPSYSDVDLSLDFADLSLGDEYIAAASYDEPPIPEYLMPLLEECHQEDIGPHDFSSFIESFPYDEILHQAREKAGGDLYFKKIGEASYSEVFGIGNVVLKVIPLRDETPEAPHTADAAKPALRLAPRGTRTVEDQGNHDGPPPSDAQDVRKEIVVTRAMGEVHRGFVKLLKTYVVKGKYPEALLQLWDDYYEEKGSESVRPDTFTLSQAYAIIVLPNGGPDLEAYTFSHPMKSGWRQAASIFWQVAKSLTHAEHLVSFEHRDLHWGQILVKNVASQKPRLKDLNVNQNSGPKGRSSATRQKRVPMDDLEHGVQVTLIDLGLSRMDAGDGSDGDRVQWTPFDEEVFMGEGDYQFDVYRMMRTHVRRDWDGYHPLTNVMWLHYLSTKLLKAKGLKAPSTTVKKPVATKESAGSSSLEPAVLSEKVCYDALVEVEQWLRQTLVEAFPGQAKAAAAAARGRGRPRASVMPHAQVAVRGEGPECAGDVVQYGTKRGWVKASRLT